MFLWGISCLHCRYSSILLPVQQNEGSIRAWESIFCLAAKTGIRTKSTEGTAALALQNANQNLLLLRTLSVSPLAFSKANAPATVCPLLPLLVRCVTGTCLHFHIDLHPFLKICRFLSPAGLLVSAYHRISHLWLPQATFVLIKQTDTWCGHVCGHVVKSLADPTAL